ncbi:MAG: hypothetical protein JWM32_2118 [Verrucomicrobia bacterium]|nr:hypothetical protein [Verrucomicrobiota bacterium]
MKNRTRQLYVSPGFGSGMAFVSWDAGEDPYLRASDYLPDEDLPVEKRQGLQRNWMQAIKHLPKVWSRLVRQPLWRQAAKPVVSV